MKLQTNVMILLATPSLFAGYLTIVIIDVIQDAPIIRTSYIKSAIRPPSFVIKSRYNFTIAGCLEEYFNCKSDVTQPDRKYEPTQLYYGIYQSSQQVLFYVVEDSDNDPFVKYFKGKEFMNYLKRY
ncbi:hypothetical protein GLOIN_2v1474578 [Rhizophagus irregularis DAOM 181602=DAOM 197198]|nr:hypothetical protein GLOIN_2v1474578 [Rhizophagus irregularis DAOM 181602=DAOM 197198]